VSVTFVPSDGTTPLPVLVNGEPENVDEERASEILGLEDFEVVVDLGGGDEAEVAKYYTCDFSYVSDALFCDCLVLTSSVSSTGIREN
jgi:glutamate N-acetyltransferase / amino-acid N-acetyltransferase